VQPRSRGSACCHPGCGSRRSHLCTGAFYIDTEKAELGGVGLPLALTPNTILVHADPQAGRQPLHVAVQVQLPQVAALLVDAVVNLSDPEQVPALLSRPTQVGDHCPIVRLSACSP
jgi:hypothetical protein